jgi:carboxyl-terminal processing protease
MRLRRFLDAMTHRFRLIFVSSSLGLVLLLLVGVKMGRGAGNDNDPYKQFGVFSEVITRIKSDYVEEPDMKNVTLGALNGLLESIDPYASYLNADQYKQYLQSKSGPQGNVGLVLTRRFGYVAVVDAIEGSPAAKAGFNTGDVLESIRGIGTRDMPLAYAEMLLLGEPGSEIEIQVLRARKPEPEKAKLTRAAIALPKPVVNLLPESAVHIVAQSLDAKLADAFKKGVETAVSKNASKLVLDLRNCATGEPGTGVELAKLFLLGGKIGHVEGQRVAKQEYSAAPAQVLWKGPLAVIVNRGTSGAAETLAAALLDNKRADLIGERTFGNAAQRKALTLDDGSAVLLSVAKYYSPAGKAIQDNGVTPNYPMIDAGAGDGDPDGDGPLPAPEPNKEDLLLKKALEVLSGVKTLAGLNPDAALRKY